MAYTFEVQNERPAIPSKSQHAPLIDAVLATAGTTRSIVLAPGKGEKADDLLAKLRQVCCVAVGKTKKPLRVRGVVKADKVYLWCESKDGEQRSEPVPETTTPTGPLDETEQRVVKSLQLAGDEGLGLNDLARSLYGRDADRKAPALRVVLAGLCQRRLLLQDRDLKYSMSKQQRCA